MLSKFSFKEIEQCLLNKPKGIIFSVALCLNLIIGYFDYLTGNDISLTLFYLGPLLTVVWFIGIRAGIIMSLICVATIGTANYLFLEHHLSVFTIMWNLSLIEGFFIIITLFSSQIKHHIIEQKQAEEDLLANKRELLESQRTAHLGNWDMDLQTGKCKWSDESYRIFGFEPGSFEPTFNRFIESVHQADRKVVEAYFPDIMSGKLSQVQLDFRIIRPSGEERVIGVRLEIIKDRNGKPFKLNGISLDITERKRAEEELRESKKFLQTIIDTEPECVKLLDANGALLHMNQAGLDMIQAESLEQVKGQCVCGLVAPEHRAAFEALTERVFCGESGTLEFETIGLKGRHIWLETHAVPLRNDKEEIIALLGITRDITERKKAQDALADEKERLTVTLRSIGDAVIVTDTKGTVTLINRVAEELTGWHGEEALGKPLSAVFNIINEGTRLPCRNPVDDVLSKGLIVGLANHTALIRRDGTEIIIADSAAPIRDRGSNIIGVVLVFRDITEQYRMEAEMQKMQKLESLGVLAGGLAHDFNNLLMGIMGNISIVKMHLNPDNTDYARLTAADRAVERATHLTQQLLTFAKGGAPIKRVLPMGELVRESVDFAISGSKIRCNYNIPDNLWNAEVDKGQIAQVFNNLSINAMHAMPVGGTVSISMENVTLQGNSVPTLRAGDYVKIVFSDSGTGIPEEHLSKIFDPYFTTKQQGSGLGLTTVFSIIKKHDGYITVDSKVGTGTRFIIYLPATKDSGHTDTSTKDTMTTGYGKILLMDDEELVRDVAGEMLTTLGYNVEFAEDGEKAIAMYKKAFEEKNPFRVVIMDLTIPGGVGGKEAVGEILEIDHKAKVIASSGYATDPIMSDSKKYGFSGVMIKPYRIEQMSETITRVLTLQ
ncbi:MAG: PAS domain S-box protein [Nitrospirae bacterium]|nr:PAS domain S-box protein [Nitrospirota bacterium]